MNNFTTGFIYKIVDDNDNNNNYFYIGSTCLTLQDRFKQHKYDYKKYLNNKRPFQTSFLIMQKDYKSIYLIESVNFFNKFELFERERFHIENNNCINKNLPNNFFYF
jgi:predicted GIY-YIG superfamily endonuclease